MVSADTTQAGRLWRREQWVLWVLMALLYVMFAGHRSEAYPDAGPLILGMGLTVGSIVLLVAVARADAGKTPSVQETFNVTYRGLLRYLAYFALTSTVLMPVSQFITLFGVLICILVGDAYMLRLAWRVFPAL